MGTITKINTSSDETGTFWTIYGKGSGIRIDFEPYPRQLGGFTAPHLAISNLTGKSAVSIGESSSKICYFPATGETSEGQDY